MHTVQITFTGWTELTKEIYIQDRCPFLFPVPGPKLPVRIHKLKEALDFHSMHTAPIVQAHLQIPPTNDTHISRGVCDTSQAHTFSLVILGANGNH